MIIKIQDKERQINSQEDFDNVFEEMLFYFKIEEWERAIKEWRVHTFEEVFAEYGV